LSRRRRDRRALKVHEGRPHIGDLLINGDIDIRKKDGSPHHGVGIKPTVPVRRTLAGVIAGRDELLEKGIEAVSQP
jgi:hypothetical protein